MVRRIVISICLLPIVTILGSEFWDDVDAIEKELSDPKDLPTQATTIQTQRVQLSEPASTQTGYLKNYYGRAKTVDKEDLLMFKLATKINKSYPKNVSTEIVEDMVLKLEDYRKWPELRIYNEEDYFNYWARVCMFFWEDPLVDTHRHACIVKTNIEFPHYRRIFIRLQAKYLDVLCCRCVHYEKIVQYPLFPPDSFEIHKSSDNEFILFRPRSKTNHRTLVIKGLRCGITLPDPNVFNY